MAPEENMVSLVELRDEVREFDTTDVQQAKTKLEGFLNQFGNGEYCEICMKDGNYFRMEDEAHVFGVRRSFEHDNYLDHAFTNNQIRLPLPFTMYVNGSIRISVENSRIQFHRIILKVRSQKKLEKGEPIYNRDIKTYARFDFDDLNDLREALINIAPFVTAYKNYLQENKIEITNIINNLKF